ncbi:uncharacterized protein LOC101741550 isoform X2 [Bombyx mori]|uniref:uncharacterized protein LOC101741550 isoform X2 n=1 Tax=Bombyx mori TaxID=7091 RepID=UPI002ED636D1
MSDSSDDNQKPQILTAEYKDGQLQIVEVTPFDRDRTESLTELSCSGSSKQYMQVIDGDKGLVQFDLLNLTLVRSQDGEESYQLLANDCEGEGSENAVTCVLQTSDTEDRDNQEYVMVDSDNGQGPLFFLQSALPQVNSQQKKDETQVVHVTQKVPSATEILEKAKALQKVKATIAQAAPRRRGRKRKSDLPPPHELLASPNFKLFLYACKMCPFKCNSIKEMSEHKAAIHGAARARGGGRGAAVTLQCARCPLLADTHTQLAKHVQEAHCTTAPETIRLNTEEVEAADVLVCGACGFESSSRHDFRRHIEDEHGVNTC